MGSRCPEVPIKLTAPIWYGLAHLATKVNPNGHHVFAVMARVTAMAIPPEKAASCFMSGPTKASKRRWMNFKAAKPQPLPEPFDMSVR